VTAAGTAGPGGAPAVDDVTGLLAALPLKAAFGSAEVRER
jgi:hypothetical protein